MTALVVRDAEPDDAGTVARVHVRTWQIAYAHAFPTQVLAELTEEPRREFWRETIEQRVPPAHVFVAESDDDVVGFCSLGPVSPFTGTTGNEGELYAIYVLPEAWGGGVGQALMTETLARLRADGFPEAVLWVLEDNPRSRRFYELAGWRDDGVRRVETIRGVDVREARYRIALD